MYLALQQKVTPALQSHFVQKISPPYCAFPCPCTGYNVQGPSLNLHVWMEEPQLLHACKVTNIEQKYHLLVPISSNTSTHQQLSEANIARKFQMLTANVTEIFNWIITKKKFMSPSSLQRTITTEKHQCGPMSSSITKKKTWYS